VAITDRRLARVVRACRELPGHELFQYLDRDGERQVGGSEEVNAYLRQATGEDFTAKDFRTWGGTVLALSALLAVGCDSGEPELARKPGPARARDANHAVVEAVKRVAEQLGNRPAICRKYYIHPGVIAAFLAGKLEGEPASPGSSLSPADLHRLEEQTLDLLRRLPPADAAPRRRPRARRERRRPGGDRGGSGAARRAASPLVMLR
jgi:DNA topoisomerase-1